MSETYDADAVACHCGGDEIGHQVGREGCAEVPIEMRSYVRPARLPGAQALTSARGTCPNCGRKVSVRRVTLHTSIKRWTEHGDVREADTRVLEDSIGVWPGLVEHRRPRRSETCPGSGAIPAELRYQLPRNVWRNWLRRGEGWGLVPKPQGMLQVVQPHLKAAIERYDIAQRQAREAGEPERPEGRFLRSDTVVTPT